MMNLGGPSSLDKVYGFLERLFSDREIIQLPFQKFSGPLLAWRRTPKIKHDYDKIGGGSPIRKWTELQGEAMCRVLDEKSPETSPHKLYVAFRYADPLTQDTLLKMKEDGIKIAIAFTQYPQYSCTTTGSSINELYRQIMSNKMQNEFNWSIIDRWGSNSLLCKAFAKLIKDELKNWQPDKRDKVVLVFSAHSIPHRIVDRGDTYLMEVADTVQLVMRELGHSNAYRLVWQSKVGPLPWLGPQTMDALVGFHKINVNDIIIIPIAFTSDHIETLYELDQTYVSEANKLGMNVRRCKSLNMEPLFINSLVDVVLNHLKNQNSTQAKNPQLSLRCPGCNNNFCKDSKEFFIQIKSKI